MKLLGEPDDDVSDATRTPNPALYSVELEGGHRARVDEDQDAIR